MSNSIEEEVKKDEMDTLKEEEIWRSRRERMNNALAAVRTAVQQDPAEVHAPVRRLADVINRTAAVEEFISVVERLAEKPIRLPFTISGAIGQFTAPRRSARRQGRHRKASG